MSDEFKINESKKNEIASKLQIDKSEVDKLFEAYKESSSCFNGQFLAHVMRGIECSIREQLKNKRFVIVCEPFNPEQHADSILNSNSASEQKPASSVYYPPNYDPHKKGILSFFKNRSRFVINYNCNLCDRELRDYLAHEIGHLFYKKYTNKLTRGLHKHWDTYETDPYEEKLSSIFGTYIISEKNDFYNNIPESLCYNNWQELFNHFKDITYVSIF